MRKIRLLHPQHLDGIWIGQDQYRLHLAPINEFPEPWCWKISERVRKATYILSGLKKTESQTWGRNCSKNFLELIIPSGLKKNRVPDMGEKWLQEYLFSTLEEILGLCLFLFHFSAMSGTLFFSNHQNERFPLNLFLIFFSTRVLETHLGGLKAACIGPALSKFCPSVGDGST